MAIRKQFRFGPVAMSATLTTNILSPGTTTGGVASTSSPYDKLAIVLRHLRIVNKTAGAVTFSLWLGGTGGNVAGTEVVGIGKSVPANDVYDWYGELPIYNGDFLVGGAGSGTSLTIQGEGEIGLA